MLQQHNPPHPGELIKRTYIDPFERISMNFVANELGVAKSTFSRLINGISDISPEMAIRLSVVLGRSPESWMQLQDNYDLWKARKKVNVKKLKSLDYHAA